LDVFGFKYLGLDQERVPKLLKDLCSSGYVQLEGALDFDQDAYELLRKAKFGAKYCIFNDTFYSTGTPNKPPWRCQKTLDSTLKGPLLQVLTRCATDFFQCDVTASELKLLNRDPGLDEDDNVGLLQQIRHTDLNRLRVSRQGNAWPADGDIFTAVLTVEDVDEMVGWGVASDEPINLVSSTRRLDVHGPQGPRWIGGGDNHRSLRNGIIARSGPRRFVVDEHYKPSPADAAVIKMESSTIKSTKGTVTFMAHNFVHAGDASTH
jgi:hypothetical protein